MGIVGRHHGEPNTDRAHHPMGQDWGRLVAAYVATRTFRARVLHDTTGEGTTGLDDQYAEQYFAEIGAEIMGAGMFGLHAHPDDPDWRGWWGDEPPFRARSSCSPTRSARPSRWQAGPPSTWDDLRGLESGHAVKAEAAPSGTVHLTFRR